MLGTSLRLLLVIVKDTFTISYYSEWLYGFIMTPTLFLEHRLKIKHKKTEP